MAMAIKKNVLRAAEGFTLHQTGSATIALMKNNGATGTTFTCGCDGGGACRVDLDGKTASCEEDGCHGECKWSVNLPGLLGVHGLLLRSE